jgi:uncharacterized protein (TIGR02145 family)
MPIQKHCVYYRDDENKIYYYDNSNNRKYVNSTFYDKDTDELYYFDENGERHVIDIEASSSVRVSYDSVTEELHLDFSPIPADSVLIGGRRYHYIQIGNQLWIDENLDYKFAYNGGILPIGSSGTPSTPSAWYYNNNETDYGIDGTYKCGLLYNWYAVKYLEDNKSTLLPSGWHVPSTTEWDALATAVGGRSTAGTVLKSTTDWTSGNGTDDFGFAAFPAGIRDLSSFLFLGALARFWTANESSSSDAYVRFFNASASILSDYYSKDYAHSVRLVKTLT